MALQITGQGQGLVLNASQKSGAPSALSTGWHNELLATELLPRYAYGTLAQTAFFGANTAQQALSVASSTYTGLAISNPAGSGHNLIIIDAAFALGTLQTGLGAVVLGYAPAVSLTTGSSSGPTGLSTIVGGGANSVAKVGASASLGSAPTIIRALAGTQWVTTGTTSNIQIVKDEIAGAIVVPPGQLICIEAITTAVTGLAHFTWLELPL